MSAVPAGTDGPVRVDRVGAVTVVTIDRPAARNAVDGPTAAALHDAFVAFDADADSSVAVLSGAAGTFCAGADLKAIGSERANPVHIAAGTPGPMGPTRLNLSKPVIAAVEGYAVAGGLELAVWCDLRVVAEDAVFGVFCRRWGVPLIDGGTVRLPRLVGASVAMDLILTGRPVDAAEALRIGLANRVCAPGRALATAVELAEHLAAFPQTCLRADLMSARAAFDAPVADRLLTEARDGLAALRSGDTRAGIARFAAGAGRGGSFEG
jgi:enoyl-CoA hydratase